MKIDEMRRTLAACPNCANFLRSCLLFQSSLNGQEKKLWRVVTELEFEKVADEAMKYGLMSLISAIVAFQVFQYEHDKARMMLAANIMLMDYLSNPNCNIRRWISEEKINENQEIENDSSSILPE